MEKVSEEEKKQLDELKDALDNDETPDGFEKAEDKNFTYDEMDFENNEYFCFTGDNQWLRIVFDNIKASGLPFLWNGHAEGLKRKYEMRFEDACDAIYVMKKQ